jgi:hypothetical protein
VIVEKVALRIILSALSGVDVTDFVTVPPVPEQVRVYVTPTPVPTFCVPEVAFAPDQLGYVVPPEAVQDVALVEDQVST